MKIAIYGDSYGHSVEENVDGDLIDRGKSWPNYLAEKHTVTNFSYAGSSLFYSYKLFLENNKNFDYNIFLVTEPNRITLSDNLNLPTQGRLTKHINLNLIDSYGLSGNDNSNKIISAIKSYYSVVHNQQAVDIFHNLMLENIIRINQNTLIIPCFDSSIPNTQTSLTNISKYEFLNSKIFKLIELKRYYCWTPIEDKNDKWSYFDYRKCHLNEENNKILSSIIENAVNSKQQNINLNLNQFVQASNDIEYYLLYINLNNNSKERRLNGELHNLYNKLLIDSQLKVYNKRL